jgi:hypothetical protein
MFDVLSLVLGLSLSAIVGALAARVNLDMGGDQVLSFVGGGVIAVFFGAFVVHWYFLSPAERCAVDAVIGLVDSCLPKGWHPPIVLP